jgi:hypothetical protein
MPAHPTDETERGRSRQFSRRALLAATGTSLVAGCAGDTGGEDSPTMTPPDTPDTTPTATDTATTTPGATTPITGTAGGETDVAVTDYGATPDDDSDDTAAIREAFAAAATEGATVTFEAGTYRLQGTDFRSLDRPVPLDYPLLSLADYQGLTIEGNGARLAAAGRLVDGKRHFAASLTLDDCVDTTVRDLTIDWDRDPPHSAGTVVEEADEYVDVDLADAYEPREGLFATGIIRYDQERGFVTAPFLSQGRFGDRQCQPRSGGVLRVPKSPDTSGDQFEQGQGILVRHANAGGMGVHTYNVDGFTLEGVTLHSLPGMAVNVFAGNDVTISDISVVPREGYWQSACRDGFHIGDVTGDLTLEGCTVTHTGDDAMNLKCRRYGVSEIPDARTVVIKKPATNGWYENIPFAAGDEVELGHSGTHPLIPAVTRTIAEFEKSATRRNAGAVNATYTLTLERDLPQAVRDAETVSLINATHTPDSVTVRNCYSGKLRGGCRFQLDHTTIEDSEFESLRGNAVLLQAGGPEGETVNDFTLRNNRFVNCSHTGGGGGIVTTFPHGPGDTAALPSDLYADHTYEGNVFEADMRPEFPAINLNWVSDLTIADNQFRGVRAQPVQLQAQVDCATTTVDGRDGCQPYGVE